MVPLAQALLALLLGAAEPVVAQAHHDEVWWTVGRTATPEELAFRWGIPSTDLLALNPERHLVRGRPVPAGTRLRVFVARPGAPARAIGAPNRGRLADGRPMPEGEGWTLRSGRRRAWGTRLTVMTLAQVLRAYHDQYLEGPPIAVGEIARRRGGRVEPHAAHRTGRDVDLGYVLTVPHPADRFLRASADNLDVKKTWFLVRTLLRTGKVQKIFMSVTVQRLLLRHARQNTTSEELSRYFAAANPNPGAITLIRHRRRHLNHMHVRFRCAPDNRRCRAKPV